MAQQNDFKATEADGQAAPEPVTAAAGSDAAEQAAGDDMAVTYGTRSRQRTGTARPNYAEDKDIEMDVYDYYHDKKDADAKRSSSRQASATATGDAARGGAVSRKGADEAKAGSSQNGPRGQSSNGATSASQATQASGAVQPSRKRKAAAQQPGAASAVSTRRANNSGAPQNPGSRWPESNLLTFENCNGRPEKGRMVADDGTVLEPNDHVYLVCEPPGDPYYLGRIMEFLHVKNDGTRPVDAVRINWFYRPKDIGRKVQDTRLVFATMHSDISPLTALRGKCQIRHRVEIDNMDEYRKMPDSFWYEKLYDRYIQKNYDLIPTSTIVNVPEKVKKVLDERWKYVLVEQGRGKELTSAVKLCKRCSGYCASNDSVDCAVCRNTYHMNCVRPPLLKKPSRGFAWSCAACSRAQERKLEAQNTIHAADANGDHDDDEMLDEDEEDLFLADTGRTTPADNDESHHQGTAEQIYQASLWPYRYLGVHCKPEDALDYDDRIYPRASTRIGPRHQAAVGPWPGRPVEYEKLAETKKIGKKDGKLSKEAQAAQDAEKIRRGRRPKWIQDQPPGYMRRGEDLDQDDANNTSTLLWKPPPETSSVRDEVPTYVEEASGLSKKLGLPERSTNIQDVALETLYQQEYDAKAALKALPGIEREVFKEPDLAPAELKKFEEAVSKYGSELHLVMKHVKTLTPGEVVRYYYTWKKTGRGQQIWGNYSGRKGKKEARRAEAVATKFADDVADADDDSAFDSAKAVEKKRGFMCQFCRTTKSRQWRRAPNAAPGLVTEDGVQATGKDKGAQYVVALCRRCAELWRRYAVRYEELDEVAKKVAQAGGRAWKRRQDEELLKELQAAEEWGLITPEREMTPSTAAALPNGQEPPRKKLKGVLERDLEADRSDSASASASGAFRKKDKASEPPAVPEIPKPRTLPCAVCGQLEPLGDQHVSCRECRLTVHRNCYGILDNRIQGKWVCGMCSNDKSPQVSIHYKCVLCPVEHTEHDFVEQPKLTHHKKKMSEKDREREKMEVQQARKAAEYYRKKQEDMSRPLNPREPLKRTADNNWVHVTCAVWTPEVKFGNARAMEPSEGIPSIPRARYDDTCQACHQKGGACVACHSCRTPLHVECARQQGYLLGFDITPVKSSRRDQFNIVTAKGESGTMSAAVWCKEHKPTKTVVHEMHEIVNEAGLSALQLYVQNFKQADLTLTGTVRRANLITMAAKMSGTPPVQSGVRRPSTTNGSSGVLPAQPNGDADPASNAQQPGEKVCITCGIDASPRWWPIDTIQERELTNGHHGSIGSEAKKFVEQRKFQCHKCRKLNRTPKPHPPPARPPMSGSDASGLRAPLPEPGLGISMPPLRSPPVQVAPPPSIPEYRDSRSTSHAWPQHPPTRTAASPVQAPTMGARPGPASHAYPAPGPPPRAAYNDWGHRPSSQHGSPPRHLNGGPPPLSNGPPASTFTSLRPPAMSGPPPAGPLPVGHQHPQPSQPYVNGLPPSPRRPSGPAPPSPYMASFHGGTSHGTAPPGATHSHGLSNGGPPSHPSRMEGFSQGLHPQRSYSGPQGSPPAARNGLPAAQEPPGSAGSAGGRANDNRPPSGASASPSLRNLLS